MMQGSRGPIARVVAIVALTVLITAACGGGQQTAPAPSAAAPATPAATVAAAPATATPLKVEKATIGWASADAIYSPLWYALDKGILLKYGVDAELLFFDSGAKGGQALVAGQVDLLMNNGVSAINAKLSGADARILGVTVGVLSGGIYVAKDIQTTDQLKGKKWAISSFGSEADLAAQLALKSFGLDPAKDVTIVQVGSQGNRFAALETGQVQATSLLPPVSNKAEAGGYKKVADLPKIAPDYFSVGPAAMAKTIQERRPVVKAFLKSLAEATAAFKKDRAGGVALIQKYLKVDNIADAQAAYDYYAPLFNGSLRPTDKSIQFHLDQIALTDPRAKTAKVSEFEDLSVLTEIENEGFFKTLP